MREVGLELHDGNTRIVYCKDSRRSGRHEHTSFAFLGYVFRPRQARRRNGGYFTSFLPAVNPKALKTMSERLRGIRIHAHVNLTLEELAVWLNPIVAGWMQYYGRFYRSALYPLLRRINTYLRCWAANKYRRLRPHKRLKRWWAGLLQREPRLFARWRWVHAC